MYYHDPVTVQKKDIVKLLQKTPALHILLKMDHRPKKTTPETPLGTSLNVHIIDNLKSELPHYLAAVEDINIDIDPLMWWKDKENNLPFWAAPCRKVLLVQPSSAAVERVFSLLKGSFSCKQTSALEDYSIECSLMLQYNSRN